MRFTEFLTSQPEEITEATPFKGYGNHKGVLTRSITRDEREAAAQKEANKQALKAASKPVPIDLAAVARDIEHAVGGTFPDGDPIDSLIKHWAHKVKEGQLIALLDKAAKKHLGSKSYNDYLATTWDDFTSDNPELTHGITNPWK